MRGLAITCFFLSGASGLIFQVIWTRMFSLVFGATALAISTVLTAFMGGLALGSFLAGRWADRIKDPLRIYAIAEAGIGLSALLLPLVVAHFDELNRFLYQHLTDRFILLSLARFVAASALIIVPTTLMGATLPLLSRYFVQTQGEHARVGMRVGTLYAINTTGAVIGAAAGGFILLPALGLATTNRVAAATNIGLALVVLLGYKLRGRLQRPKVDEDVVELLDEIGAVQATPIVISPRARRATLFAFALSGAAAMVYQVIWSRALNLAIGSSVFSFTIVLTGFLIGLALGAALIGRLTAGSRNPVGLLALNHLVIALCVGISYLMLDHLGHIFLSFIGRESINASRTMWSQFGVTLLALLPATIAMGGIFPLTIRILSSSLDRVGRDVGNAYSVNTVGAIVGSFCAGFIVIPVLQMQPGIYAAVCLNLLIAIVLGLLANWSLTKKTITVGVAVLFVVWGPMLPQWNLHYVSAGVFRPTIAREVMKTGQWEAPKLVYYRDGISTTVTVEQWSDKHFSMKNNGKVDASTGDDMPTQVVVGLLPLLLHPRSPAIRPKVALIGFASGVSAGSILQYPIKRLDVVELEPAILEAARFFTHVNHDPPKDPRTRVYTDDGRNFLAAGSELYDVIVNEPSNPWITGVSNLFTREYFEIGRGRLQKDGIFCTWAQLYEMAPRRIKSIYRSFTSVFPYTYAFSAATLSSDTFLIGSSTPLKLDIRKLRKAFTDERLRKELIRGDIEKPDDLIALTLMGPDEMKAFVSGAPLNTDDNALVEFHAPLDLYNHKQFDYYLSKIYGRNWLYGRLAGFIDGYSSSADYAGLLRSLLTHGRIREAHYYSEKVDETSDETSKTVLQVLELLEPREVLDREVKLSAGGPDLTPPKGPKKPLAPATALRVAHEYRRVEYLTSRGDYRGALDLVEGWPERAREEAGCDFHLLWGFLAYKTNNFHEAVNILEPCYDKSSFIKKRPSILYYAGRVFYTNADFSKAVTALERWIEHREAAGLPAIPKPQLPASLPTSQPSSRPTSRPVSPRL